MSKWWVLREPDDQGGSLDWFSIGKALHDYNKDDYIPCSFYTDSQNLEFVYTKYISRTELLTGNYRLYEELSSLVENVSIEFKQII